MCVPFIQLHVNILHIYIGRCLSSHDWLTATICQLLLYCRVLLHGHRDNSSGRSQRGGVGVGGMWQGYRVYDNIGDGGMGELLG
jgi:hypothetical protein